MPKLELKIQSWKTKILILRERMNFFLKRKIIIITWGKEATNEVHK